MRVRVVTFDYPTRFLCLAASHVDSAAFLISFFAAAVAGGHQDSGEAAGVQHDQQLELHRPRRQSASRRRGVHQTGQGRPRHQHSRGQFRSDSDRVDTLHVLHYAPSFVVSGR